MKKIKDKNLYVRLQLKRGRRNTIRRLKRKRKRKHWRRLFQGENKEYRKNFSNNVYEFGKNLVRAPKIFSLWSNTEKTAHFLQNINTLWEKGQKVFVVLRNVEQIDYSATTVLLSLMHRFRIEGIKFNGDFPRNDESHKILEESQFFERLFQYNYPSSKDYTVKRYNQIIGETGTQTMSPQTSLDICKDVSETITGLPNYVFPSLHPILIELMQNTYEHAGENEGTVYWWLSMSHDKDKGEVSFHFIDYGRGVIDSVLNKENNRITRAFKKTASSLFNFQNFSKIILKLLNEEHTKEKTEYYRGKGVPSLKKAFDNNRIKCLGIITNQAFVDLDQNNFQELRTNFTGTYITWKLDNECEKKICLEK